MAWRMNVRMYESCSCRMVCRCTLGPAEPDQGWCSGVIGIEVLSGDSEGVELTGARAVVHVELPGDFLGGIDKAKLYLDTSLSDAQRAELDAIFHGERGGLWAAMREAVGSWLPSDVVDITLEGGDSPRFAVPDVGTTTLEPLKTERGDRTTLRNAPVAAAFGQTNLELATATESRWADPDLRSWESLGYGAVSVAEWVG
jgi:hypothetical protein